MLDEIMRYYIEITNNRHVFGIDLNNIILWDNIIRLYDEH